MKPFFRLCILAAALFFVSCHKEVVTVPEVTKPQPGEYTLPLIETSDIHGYIVDNESGETSSTGTIHYKLAYVADKVKDIRGHGDSYQKERLLLVDGGDIYQGATISNLQQGRPLYIAMHKMEYDAVAVGNHEFDWGLENTVDPDATLPDYEQDGHSHSNKVPVVCANLYLDGSRASCTRDYVIVEKNATNPQGGAVKVKIAVIGFAVNYGASIISSQFYDKGYSIDYDLSIANRIASQLEASGRCDATVLLVHGEAEQAAQELGDSSAIDLVLGGHTHYATTGVTDRGLVYAQAGNKCDNYAYAELHFNVDQQGLLSFSDIRSQQVFFVDTARDKHTHESDNADDLDDEIIAVSNDALAAVAEQLHDVIGHIDVSATNFDIVGSGGRATVISNWMNDIVRRIGDADVAFLNSGGIRTYFSLGGEPTRNITAYDVYEMFPFGNTVYVYQITYAELLQLFEYAMTSGGKGLLYYMMGIDCYFTQSEEHTNASGSTYRIYTVHSLSKDGTEIYHNGTWADGWASRTLKVAVSNYIATNDRYDPYTDRCNPLVQWNDTPRLIINNLVDNENAVRVLKAEAAASGGLLHIDTAPHFILLQEQQH